MEERWPSSFCAADDEANTPALARHHERYTEACRLRRADLGISYSSEAALELHARIVLQNALNPHCA